MVPRARRPVTSRRGPVVAGLMLTMALAAMDQTIVATAVPALVRDLGSFSLFPWVIAAYMLTQAVCTPIYGRLADVYGRKPMLIAGIVAFLAGSLLAAVSWSMPMLIVARAIQGIGAGAVQSVTQTVAGDLYPIAERGRISAWLSTVWGVSALVGPALGGLLSEYASWRWIFWLNLPVGAAALVVIGVWLREPGVRGSGSSRLDISGTLLLAGAVVTIMLGLQFGAWWLIGCGLILVAAFAWWERRAAEPLIPPWIWRDRMLLGSFLGSAVVGMALIAPTVYLPTFAQGVLGASAVAAGFALAVQSMSWPLAASFAARLYLRFGFRDTALAGIVLLLVSGVMFAMLSPSSSVLYAGLCSFVNGGGLGLISVSMLVAAQSQVGYDRRGVVTGGVIFFRITGGALGTAVFAAVANAALARELGGRAGSVDEAARALNGGADGPQVEMIKTALAGAVHQVFLVMIGVGVLGLLAIFVLPRRRIDPAAAESSP
ncbi:MDR family MFS transporter [Spongiactinospora sp. TRM90649]|uniref:MDR family MFS transporter n=1 Tax=Spongiactinospora sp. TRM90649 TaxID=3031114 RepID=UPI0023F91F8C|nr:MDR family MFS transporter [Spongiactinospora sp. TRM90649]MDF5752209.1 MDR family MFS transporter [Spongiactinospora sp. TRM90649]